MAKIVTLTKGGIEKLIKAAGTVSPTSQKLAQYDGNGCIATNDPRFALDCVNKSYLESKLNGLGGGGGTGTSTPTPNAIAAYDSNGVLRSTPKPEGQNWVNNNDVVTFSDLKNRRVNDTYQEFLDLKKATVAFVAKMTAYDPVTGGRVDLPAPDTNEFPWIRRTTGNGGGHEYVLDAGNAYVIEMAMYGKAYFQSYDMFANGTGFWNLTTPNSEKWKSEQSILFRKGGQPNVWLSHNGWVKEAAGIAILRITKIPGITI